ncbi:phytanoyl-CoA dioxygenase family protein [Streptomyces rectiviolaceus]|uniref:Phytanoyl-CoA dioxygenase n=1 Tax=Streptomyces rectiviolaceus TaxID=332591 RepID=A0ABP6M8L9_9ACTN
MTAPKSKALPHVLTDEQVAQFRHDGYLLIENVLTPGETDHYRSVILDLVPRDLAFPQEWRVADGRIKPHRLHEDQTFDVPGLIPLMGNETLYQVMAQLHDTYRLRAFDGSIGITLRNDAHPDQVRSQRLHLDASVPPDTDFLFTAQELQLGGCYYLTDVEPGGGGIHVVPRGHRLVEEEVRAAGSAGVNGRELYGNWQHIAHLKSIEVSGAAGSFVLLHHLMPHAASHNRRPTARIAHFMRYVPVPHAHGAHVPLPHDRYDDTQLAAMTPLTRKLLGLDPWG